MRHERPPEPNALAPENTLAGLATLDPAEDLQVTFCRPGGISSMSHARLWEEVERVARLFDQMGLRRGDRVGVCLGNRAEWVLIDLACLHLGLVVAGFDPMKFVPSAALMDRYGLRVLVTEEAMPGTMPVTRLHDAPDPAWPLPPWPAYRAGDEVALKFTSGSTGAAKAIAATWGSIGMSLSAVEEMFDHGPGDTLFVFLTLSLLQQRYWVYTALLRGTDLVIATPQTALFALRAAQPSVIMGVPAFFETLKTLIETEADAAGCTPREAAKSATGGRVRYMWTGSAPIRPALLAWLEDVAGLPVFEGYGMNETCIVTKNHPGACRRGSAGRPVRGKEVFVGEDGVIRVRARFPVNTRYAFADPGASARVFRGDTVWTGDLGRIDEDGFLWITGRADDVIVLENGRNIATREIEERALAVPGVSHCTLAGSGRPWLVALVAAAEGADLGAVLAAINADATPDTRVHSALRMTAPPTEANGCLTSQGKPVRKAILDAHSDLIEAAYSKENDHARA
ncbi:MAG: AMP-binding protein [Rhodobacteraceae bacterium]|nr:AMP-binding protein [Paracoccaceae bacterium]